MVTIISEPSSLESSEIAIEVFVTLAIVVVIEALALPELSVLVNLRLS